MVVYLSVADASRILQVTPQTVRLMIRRGTLPVTAMTVGGIHLFRQDDIERLAAARQARRPVTEFQKAGAATEKPST